MTDYIDRQEAIDAVYYATGDGDKADFCADVIRSVPPADVEPVRHGRWERLVGDSRFMCSVCKCKEDVPTCNGEPTIWDYCPSCGARMEE